MAILAGASRDPAFGLGIVVIAIVIWISRPERRRLLTTMRLAGATSEQTAMTAFELGAEGSRTLERLVESGLVVATNDGRFFLVEKTNSRSGAT